MPTLDPAGTRLTKKQRKSQAHRERGKLRKAQLGSLTENGLPAPDEAEVVDAPGLDDDTNIAPDDQQVVAKPSAKRARDEDTGTDGSSAKKLRRVESESDEDSVAKPTTEPSKPKKKKGRYILFVGNLAYTTTAEAITRHFTLRAPKSKDGPDAKPLVPKAAKRPNVRLGTMKGSNAPKGYAFVEYSEPADLQRGLALHHTELDGRQINVEMTAGGGGNTEKRRQKVMEKNKKVLEQRRTADPRPRPPSNYGETTVRYSSTSGEARLSAPISSANSTQQGPKKKSSTKNPKTPIEPPLVVASGANVTPASRRWSTKPKPASKPKDTVDAY
ncbi:hypothetical protein FRB95_003244 [Tulasnella sp. JGI-2019a]|nr:hypothetical protein FRB93_005158 [Tulasnella sp. JGI-2019a]KAG9031018.1 hypothetical protein FRB95_003244 [Tulasnella sp. JGI-2019a]